MKKRKRILTALIVLIVVAVIGGAAWYFMGSRKSKKVDVYPVEMMNGVDYVDNGSELTGTIASEYVQEVYPDSAQEVKKVYVKTGDVVKEGDKLLKYNVDEQELDVKLQKLQIKAAQLEIETMEKELKNLKGTKTTGSSDQSNLAKMSASVQLLGDKLGLIPSLIPGSITVLAAGNEGVEDPTPDPLKDKKEAAINAIHAKIQENSFSYNKDKELAQALLANTGESSYQVKINQAESEEQIETLKTEALGVLDQIAALGAKRDAAKEEIQKYLETQNYGKSATEKKDKIVEDTEKVIDSAPTDNKVENAEEEIQEAKQTAMESLAKLEGGPLYTFIDDVDAQQSAVSGEGDTDQNKISFLLVMNGGSSPSITGEALKQLLEDTNYSGRYIELRIYEKAGDYPKKSPVKVVNIPQDPEMKKEIDATKTYSVDEISSLVQEKVDPAPAEHLLTSLSDYQKYQSGKGTQQSKYVYDLQQNAMIRGSVINTLIQKDKYALLREYASESEYASGASAKASITITPYTLFKESLSDVAKYTISDLNNLLVTVKTIKVTPKEKNLKKAAQGSSHVFKVTISGKNTEKLTATWSVKNAKSKSTQISSTGTLTIGSDEKASSLKIMAKVAGKTGSYTIKVTKAASSGGNDSSPDDSYDDGYDGGDDSGEGEVIYTAEELKEAIEEKEQAIAEAKQQLNEAKVNYKEAKKEVDDAVVKAKISGTVTDACTVSEVPSDGSAAIVVRAEDGMYVKTAVSEMDLKTVKVGGTIRCTSYENNQTYDAVVREVSEFPTEGSSDYSSGNPNNSYYPIVAYIENSDGLKLGDTVTVTYDSQSMGTANGDAIYLFNAYVRTEGKKSYVYKQGENGRLEKQYVKTGGTVYGQYIEILSGLSLDDYIAFPYGKNVKEGARTKISDEEENIIY